MPLCLHDSQPLWPLNKSKHVNNAYSEAAMTGALPPWAAASCSRIRRSSSSAFRSASSFRSCSSFKSRAFSLSCSARASCCCLSERRSASSARTLRMRVRSFSSIAFLSDAFLAWPQALSLVCQKSQELSNPFVIHRKNSPATWRECLT